ncbi:DUF167 domain-containing protein [Candidatus Pacearchaeota archaeon]|nr:DUF167 domain-containing protein [Candidatus Pacearchaeota archaeon]
MKFKIKVHPNSSQEKIEEIDKNYLEVWIKEKPVNNKANIKIIKILKNYFGKGIKIKSGFTSRNKIIEVSE